MYKIFIAILFYSLVSIPAISQSHEIKIDIHRALSEIPYLGYEYGIDEKWGVEVGSYYKNRYERFRLDSTSRPIDYASYKTHRIGPSVEVRRYFSVNDRDPGFMAGAMLGFELISGREKGYYSAFEKHYGVPDNRGIYTYSGGIITGYKWKLLNHLTIEPGAYLLATRFKHPIAQLESLLFDFSLWGKIGYAF